MHEDERETEGGGSLPRPSRHRLDLVRAASTICVSEPVTCLAVWSSGDIRATSQGFLSMWMWILWREFRIMLAAGNVTHSTSVEVLLLLLGVLVGLIYISFICVGEGGRLTRVRQRCWPRLELGHPGLPIILQYSRGGSSSHGNWTAWWISHSGSYFGVCPSENMPERWL